MRNEPITIGGETIGPGRRARLEIPVARLPTGTHLSLPVAVANGNRPGPRIWLSGVVHGDELNGMEIIRRVLQVLRPRSLAGTVVAVPIVNVFGFVNESRYLPDRRDLNRSFPGSPRGSLAARLAHLFLAEVVDRCQYGIDLHTGSDHRFNLPQIRADLTDPESRRLAEAFGAPVTIDSRTRDGSLREACSRRSIPVLVFEGGEAHRFNDTTVDTGVDGVLRVLAALGMRECPEHPTPPPTTVVRHTQWVRARRSGIFRTGVRAGQEVERGEPVGTIADALGDGTIQIKAPIAGIVIGYTRNPLVSQGDALVHLADTNPEAKGGPARPPS